MKKSIFLIFYACLLLLFLFVGVMIGRNTNAGYVSLTSHPETTAATQIATENIGKIDLNEASVEDLDALDGIGEVLAQRIVLYRMKNGRFNSVYDLLNVEGIGEKKFGEIVDHVYVGG